MPELWRRAAREIVSLRVWPRDLHTVRAISCVAPGEVEVTVELGKADWRWEDSLQTHIPCCSQPKPTYECPIARCGNGPLVGEQIASGTCDEDHWTLDERGRLRLDGELFVPKIADQR